jgi:membrane fusion protein, heavy metal efflux system
MMMRVVVATAFLFACESREEAAEKDPPAHGGAHTHEQSEAQQGEHEALPNRVTLTREVAARARITTTKAEEKALASTLDLTGEVVADPDARAIVTARMNARIVDVRFRENDLVSTGQALIVLESAELARARAAYTVAKAKLDAAKMHLARLDSLGDKGLSSGQERETAGADVAALEAELGAARQTLAAFGPTVLDATTGDAARITLTAPVSGRVLSRQAVRGEGVTAERVLAEIADLSHAYFQVRVFEKDTASVRQGSKAEVRLNAHPEVVFEGTVESVGHHVDANARTVLARIKIADRDNLLKVGFFGNARIVDAGGTRPQRARLAIPLHAVTEIAGRRIVFVRTNDGEFEVHEVSVGRSAEGEVEILSGLRSGEDVVSEGVFTLKSAVLKSTFGEDP